MCFIFVVLIAEKLKLMGEFMFICGVLLAENETCVSHIQDMVFTNIRSVNWR